MAGYLYNIFSIRHGKFVTFVLSQIICHVNVTVPHLPAMRVSYNPSRYKSNFIKHFSNKMDRDSVVCIVTHYGLDGPGFEARWWRDLRHPPRPVRGPPSLPQNWYRVFFLGVKRPGRGVNHPPTSSAEIKERVELYLYVPSMSAWPVIG